MTDILLTLTLWIQSLISPVPFSETEVYCLTRNAYYEAKGDSQLSQIAVTHVVLNRVNDPKYPKNACDVVHQKNKENNKTTCQFSWYCDQRLMGLKINEKDWQESYKAVKKALALYYHRSVDVTQGSQFYHATYVNPGWHKLERVTVIGSHIYYKRKDNERSTGRFVHEKVVFRTN